MLSPGAKRQGGIDYHGRQAFLEKKVCTELLPDKVQQMFHSSQRGSPLKKKWSIDASMSTSIGSNKT